MEKYMNNKGSVAGWVEVIALSMLFVVMISGVLVYFNNNYGGSNSIGLDTSAIDPNGTLASYTITAQGQIESGETEQTDEGLSLKESWTISKGAFSMVMGILSGSWIGQLVEMMMLPKAVGIVLRILFVMSLIFAVIKLFFKVGL